MKSKVLLLLSVFLIGTVGISCQTNKNNKTMNTTTVSNLDVNRFMGSWYEIARYEHSFEKGMTHVKANYSLLPDGTIRVLNSGMKNGKKKEIEGKARKKKDSNSNSKLEVSFFLWFYSDYFVFELDDNYQYAVIGSSSDKYLWILSRTPQLPQSTINDLLIKIKKRGYDTSKLYFVPQK
ncbi:MAG: lipocalin family protein [Bacteroidales bacterium]|jgi:lipocalin|nr:lipocalin family protein [Bacteroidales bacterium]MBQ1192302.1 lipocalin family protein [Bacteroidales bacterium]MBQ2303770.1 lipocalin family protein [Bacteroidales bacterium]MBQ2385672.1 lipocalin family protein [Bacteroidales bacterium]MEE0937900.1 lipocalin family protein [Bacteroidales bacterium]